MAPDTTLGSGYRSLPTSAVWSLPIDHLFPSETPSNFTTTYNHVTEVTSSPERLRESLWPDEGEASALLELYRTMFAPICPFVLIPDVDVQAGEMRLQRPFLWQAVMLTACSTDATRHQKMCDEFLTEAPQSCFVSGNTSVDMIQGLQLLIFWSVDSYTHPPAKSQHNFC